MSRIAAAAYPLSFLTGWDAWEAKQTKWIEAAKGARLLVFPEYGGAELASLGGRPANDLAAVDAITAHIEEADRRLARLAAAHEVTILAGSAPLRTGGRIVNRARLIGPDGVIGWQDKMIPTPWEREALNLGGGDHLSVFDTPVGPVGIAICYDSEFPLIGRALVEAGAEIILIPACTETVAGHTRVRTGAMARALEGQVWTVHAPLIGTNDWLEMVEANRGAAAICAPSDAGLPETGVLAEGAMDAPGWTIGEIDLEATRRVRKEGGVRGRAHWAEQDGRLRQVRNSSRP